MLDWNGNGKIDPTDIGISIGVESTQAEKKQGERKPKNPGCLTCVLFVFALVSVAAIILIGG
jgi:hypothetical protein